MKIYIHFYSFLLIVFLFCGCSTNKYLKLNTNLNTSNRNNFYLLSEEFKLIKIQDSNKSYNSTLPVNLNYSVGETNNSKPILSSKIKSNIKRLVMNSVQNKLTQNNLSSKTGTADLIFKFCGNGFIKALHYNVNNINVQYNKKIESLQKKSKAKKYGTMFLIFFLGGFVLSLLILIIGLSGAGCLAIVVALMSITSYVISAVYLILWAIALSP
ncbi:MAG: hypothetical protein JNL65_04895 [Saprospiraceae bacterium]|nr:hypothetical protein [Saprospiraceae bacterium]